jgi:inner membrane protein
MFNFFKLKPVTITLLLLILWIPIQMISSLIEERQQLSVLVHEQIANSSSRDQWVVGPILVVETEHYQQENLVNQQLVKPIHQIQFFLPDQMQINSELNSEIRSRGIYETRLYHSKNNWLAHYDLPSNFGFEKQPELSPEMAVGNIRLKSARLVMGLSDMRGLIGMPKLTMDKQALTITPGTGLDGLTGVQASLDLASLLTDPSFELSLHMDITGTEHLSMLPIGDQTSWSLAADWPHPSFVGRFLPLQHEITEHGFTATWQSSQFANAVKANIHKCFLINTQCPELKAQSFSVNLVEPVDHYQQSYRSVKYALLVLVVSFAVFYLFELLSKLAIHPMQYLFIGLALAMFYLLLISLSEVFGFAIAYLIAAAACVLLCGYYTIAVLQSWQKGLSFTCGLAVLYALLYMILRAEDMALLAGSLLLFAVLSAVMLATRHLNWYQLQSPSKSDEATEQV